jgi:hypothetical protein
LLFTTILKDFITENFNPVAYYIDIVIKVCI